MNGIQVLKNLFYGIFFFYMLQPALAQDKGLTNTSSSPYAKLKSVNIGDVRLTSGFWYERFKVCAETMVPFMMGNYMNDTLSHAFCNFEIAAGLREGKHKGPQFHDGDFYKMLEAEIMVFATTRDIKLEKEIEKIIEVIGKAQRSDGYIHTPTTIMEKLQPDNKHEFTERLNFETYNMGHLMTAACIYYRTTGRTKLLGIAERATNFLYQFYTTASGDLARNAICPSHYMGVVEMFRTTKNPKYLELAKNLIEIRGLVKNGTDDNQDRIPFKQQRKAVGHSVRANYLYAGATDVYAETGEDSLILALTSIWNDMTGNKMYITGGCGALYNGISPDGTTYNMTLVQQVHQAYGRDYQLPNVTAYNESCANIGNLLWNWRMLVLTADARYAEIMETVMYNSLLAGVSLDGKGYFYTNPLRVDDKISHQLRWSKHREGYISYCNCCPPNTIRTIAEIQEYFYSFAGKDLFIHFYGANELNTSIGNKTVKIIQQTNYPWDGKIRIETREIPSSTHLNLRIPGWSKKNILKINGKVLDKKITPGTYLYLEGPFRKGDVIELNLDLKPVLVESNPLLEETRNQVAVKYGPVVYCLESPDLPPGTDINDVRIPAGTKFKPIWTDFTGFKLLSLEGELATKNDNNWGNTLYREVENSARKKQKIKLIPYYAWDNRGISEMTVWMPKE